jgi:DNA polymerase-3 subunit alpha
MGAKTALRDVGRTLNIPLAEVNRIAKMIPDKPGMSFKKALDGDQNPDFAEELATLFKSTDPMINKMMRFAKTLEGTARHTGVHACAVIIAPGDVTDFAPVSVGRDKTITTQYDGPMAEMAGLLKMDFLGLKTLSILKTAIQLVKENHNVVIDPDHIDITDKKTYELYQRGDTVATFQFESDGMRKYLRQLQPTNIEDLIAMNALYRPGPMDNIPSFVNRKHGREKIVYPHEMLEPILKNTYGIMVYQEQIMQVARTMGKYSMGGADLLRRAMGKKKHDIMAKEKVNFVRGAAEQGVTEKTAAEVWALMEKFASYGFNKCLPGDTEVLDAETGRLVRIEDVYHGKVSLNQTATLDTDALRLITGTVSTVMDNGVKPVFKLTTASGREIEATGNHPFYTYEGWKNLEELAVGELIATPRSIPIEGKEDLTGIDFFMEKATLQLAMRKEHKNEGLELKDTLFLVKRESLQRFFHSFLGDCLKAEFRKNPIHFAEPIGELNLVFFHERVVRQLHHLLLRLGVISRISHQEATWVLSLSQQEISKVLPTARATSNGGFGKLYKFWEPIREPQSQRSLVTEHALATQGSLHLAQSSVNEYVATQHPSDIYWDRIASIEYVGEKQTYDLEIPGTHNFLANDIIVHNSHAAAYSILAFKTAYLKAHYPAEYMASVLTHNVSDIKKITFFIEECRRMGIEVLPPDINESKALFSVNAQGQIRFGLEAIKGVGHAVVETLVEERKKDGPFKTLFDLTTRMPLRSLNRKTLESLVYAGAMDCFGISRYQYFLPASDRDPANVLEKAISYGSKVQQERNSPQVSLFGDLGGGGGALQEPPIPMGTMQDGLIVEAWTELEKLNYEKEVIGFFLSGHPLNKYKWQLQAFTNCQIADLEERRPTDVRMGGIVTSVRERISRRGNKFLSFTIEDFSDSMEIALFGEQYEKFRGLIRTDEMLYITGAYQARRYDPTAFELRIFEIRIMTTDLFDQMVKYFCIELDNEHLTGEMVQQIKTLCEQHPGSKPLQFRVRDRRYQADLPLTSADWRVAPSVDFMGELEELGVDYRLG